MHTLALAGILALVSPPYPTEDPALHRWRDALEMLREAGRQIGRGQYASAKQVLQEGSVDLPPPYDAHLAGHLREFRRTRAACGPQDPQTPLRWARFCIRIHAHEEAVRLIRTYPGQLDARMVRLLAACLDLSGRTGDAIAELDRLLGRDDGRRHRTRIEEQRGLYRDPSDDLAHVDRRYGCLELSPMERGWVSLESLEAILQRTDSVQDRWVIHARIREALHGLGDAEGLAAWERRLIDEVGEDEGVRASLGAERGIRAYRCKKLALALREFRTVCETYPRSSSYDLCRFNVGCILKQQRKLDEAIGELEKLFPGPGGRDPGNYRHRAAVSISECYETMQAYEKALEYALLARDQYPYENDCPDCLVAYVQDLACRIGGLRSLASRSP
jgi:tetratricopeptide (TPR) repeat protein